MPEFTGERLIPGEVEADLWNEHISRYAFAAPLCAGKRVLDAGCGTGYGTALLAKSARAALGIDLSADAIDFALANYGSSATHFSVSACEMLPFAEASIERVVAFEVIEHLSAWRAFLEECKRVLSDSGMLFVSTPNKQQYEASRGTAGPNPYHVHEFEFGEFLNELKRVFVDVRIFGQNHAEGITFALSGDNQARAHFETDTASPEHAGFLMAVCGRAPLPSLSNFVFVPKAANVLSERARHIRLLSEELQDKEQALEHIHEEHAQLVAKFRVLKKNLEESNRWAESLNAQLAERGLRVEELQRELAESQDRAIREIDRRASEHRDQLLGWQDRTEELEKAVGERTSWARRLDEELALQVNELTRCVELLQVSEATVVARTEWAQRAQAEADRSRVEIEELRTKLTGYEMSRWVRAGRALRVGPLAR